MTRSNRAYLDHASTSPLRPEAAVAMREVLDACTAGALGDPSRSYAEALESRAFIEDARGRVAAAIGARPSEVVFCSGATEAVATVCRGVRRRGTRQVLSAVEHASVRAGSGFGAATVPVDRTARLDLDALAAAMDGEAAVVHLQWANHEVGTLQPVAQAASMCRERGVWIHSDAAQAVGQVAVDFAASGLDLMSISGHKFGGPTGTGVLVVRRGVRLDELLVGGDQERARRAGMEHVIGIAGFAAAIEAATATLDGEARRRVALLAPVEAWVDATEGVSLLGHPYERLPHLRCLAIEGIEPQPVLIELDRAGIAVHSGNSCTSESLEPSPVLAAMGVDAHRSLRISAGWSTTERDIEALLAALPAAIDRLRRLR